MVPASEVEEESPNNGSPSPASYLPTDKYESPPLLKKSRTITDNSPHFPGPLFPAVRRSTVLPPPCYRNLPFPSQIRISTSPIVTGFILLFSALTSTRLMSDHNLNNKKDGSSKPKTKSPLRPKSSFPLPNPDGGSDEKRDVPNPNVPVRKKFMSKPNEPDKEFNALVGPPWTHCCFFKLGSPLRAQKKLPPTPQDLMAFACVSFLLYAMHLRNRVAELQAQIHNCHRLSEKKAFKGLQSTDDKSSFNYGDATSRTAALYTVVFTLIVPFILYEYLDYIPRIQNVSKRILNGNIEEVPLKKRVAYMVDVCFSVYPYAKLLALLFATIFLIGFGGLALYAVSDCTFVIALWLSWTFIDDSGSHADRAGTGQRIVSVAISLVGMLIFAKTWSCHIFGSIISTITSY